MQWSYLHGQDILIYNKVVFFAILREGFETANPDLISLAFLSQALFLDLPGFFTGALLAILIGYLIVAQAEKSIYEVYLNIQHYY